jgi:predicted dehydrogenase
MKVLFVGLGSIGRRHLKLLKELVHFQALSFRSGGGGHEKDLNARYGVTEFETLEAAISECPNFAIIANPTSLHVETAMILAEAGIPFLMEKPVSDREDRLERLLQVVREKQLPALVGFQLRYHPGLKKVAEWLNSEAIGQPLGLQAQVGQWLPDWRPGRDYRDTYSAKKELGGGAILDLCHELDLAIHLMGPVRRVSCICGCYSPLEIDTEDMAEISLEHEEKRLSHVHMDYLQRGYVRSCRITGTEGTIIWNYGEGCAELSGSDGQIDYWSEPEEFHRNWLFRDQLKHWLQVLSGQATPEVSLEEGIYVTKLALAARRSSEENKHILM